MKVIIVSPEKTLYEADADGVKLPGTNGCFDILKDHAPIISTLADGVVECLGAQPYKVAISGGFVEMAHNVVSICVEKA